jgi:hypothetical protein
VGVVLLCPSESSAQHPAGRIAKILPASSPGISRWLEARSAGMYRRYWFDDPTALLAVSSALWSSSSAGERASPKGRSPELLPFWLSSRVLSLLTLVSHRSSRLLSWTFNSLQHKSGSRVHCTDRVPHLSSFRLQGLATLLTVYSP